MVILFDLNGTLTDPAPIGAPWGKPELGLEVLALAVRSAMTETILGDYRPFREHLRSALSVVSGQRGLSQERIEAALKQAGALPARPEAARALRRLRDAGFRLAVLTNSGAEAGRATLEANGLIDHFEQVLGVDAVRRFKPHRDVYEHALRAFEVEPGDAMLVAAHAWDVWGAKRAGLRGAWISGDERVYPPAAPDPDVSAEDLEGAAGAIIALRGFTPRRS
jgi:2-haloacid dehalogenase